MHKKLDKLFRAGRELRLSGEEKERVLRRLVERIGLEREGKATESKQSPMGGVAGIIPWSRWIFDRRRGVFGALPVALGLVLFAGAGVSLAAEGSLPGDILYPIKVGVTEKIRVAVASSDENKVEILARFAERRIEEAAKLAAKGEFDSENRDELELRLKNHIEEISNTIKDVSADSSVRADIAR